MESSYSLCREEELDLTPVLGCFRVLECVGVFKPFETSLFAYKLSWLLYLLALDPPKGSIKPAASCDEFKELYLFGKGCEALVSTE